MKFTIQVVVVSDDGEERQQEISSFERGEFKLTSFGLTLAESKSILKDIQEIVVEEQATTYSASQQRCPDCGGRRKKKGSHTISVRTLFGKVRVKSPRIRNCKCRHHKTRPFSPLAELDGKCFAFVQTLDTKPRRRLFELLKSQGMQENQQVVFLSDGGDDVRNLQHQLSPQAEHLLDWFHVTMRLTVMNQMAKGLPKTIGEGEDEYNLREPIAKLLESIKWYLWHGNVYQALQKIEFSPD